MCSREQLTLPFHHERRSMAGVTAKKMLTVKRREVIITNYAKHVCKINKRL